MKSGSVSLEESRHLISNVKEAARLLPTQSYTPAALDPEERECKVLKNTGAFLGRETSLEQASNKCLPFPKNLDAKAQVHHAKSTPEYFIEKIDFRRSTPLIWRKEFFTWVVVSSMSQL